MVEDPIRGPGGTGVKSWGRGHTCGNEDVNMRSQVKMKGAAKEEGDGGGGREMTPGHPRRKAKVMVHARLRC